MNDDIELPGVMLYPRALQEAIVNVLDNAIKYVPLGMDGNWGVENTRPLIRITLQPNDDTTTRGVTIVVEDNGPGILPSERDSVFERGFRGEYAKKFSHGSGIGLEYGRQMMSKMGGELAIIDTTSYHTPVNAYLKGTVMKFVLYRKIVFD